MKRGDTNGQGTQQEPDMTADRLGNKKLLTRTMGMETHQSQPLIVVQILPPRNYSTSSSDEKEHVQWAVVTYWDSICFLDLCFHIPDKRAIL